MDQIILVERLNRENAQRYAPPQFIWLATSEIEAFSERVDGKIDLLMRSGARYVLGISGDHLWSLLMGQQRTSETARMRVRCYAQVVAA